MFQKNKLCHRKDAMLIAPTLNIIKKYTSALCFHISRVLIFLKWPNIAHILGLPQQDYLLLPLWDHTLQIHLALSSVFFRKRTTLHSLQNNHGYRLLCIFRKLLSFVYQGEFKFKSLPLQALKKHEIFWILKPLMYYKTNLPAVIKTRYINLNLNLIQLYLSSFFVIHPHISLFALHFFIYCTTMKDVSLSFVQSKLMYLILSFNYIFFFFFWRIF